MSIITGFLKKPGQSNYDALTNVAAAVVIGVQSAAVGSDQVLDYYGNEYYGNADLGAINTGLSVGNEVYQQVVKPIEDVASMVQDGFVDVGDKVKNISKDLLKWLKRLGLAGLIILLVGIASLGIGFVAINKLLDKLL